MMNNELSHLHSILPSLQSGLYLLETELTDEEIVNYFKEYRFYSFYTEELLPSRGGTPFEMFVMSLCWQFDCKEFGELRLAMINSSGQQKENIIYETLMKVIKKMSNGRTSVLLLYGEPDLSSFRHEELAVLNYSVCHNGMTTLILSKKKSNGCLNQEENIVKYITLKSNYKMGNRQYKVHITYKHDELHNSGIEAICAGLHTRNIPFSIDKYDILYRDNIQRYEEEIGVSNIVIMFVIPEYLKSLDCMYEMTQLFKNGNVENRVFPIVDMSDIPRNGDGLSQIKNYWNDKKNRKAKQIKNEPGNSSYMIKEISKIDDILKTMDEFWEYIVHTNTGDYTEMVADNANLLLNEIEKQINVSSVFQDNKFTPTTETAPKQSRHIFQHGDKSIYVENNSGTININ